MSIYSTCKKIVRDGAVIDSIFKTPFFNDEPQLYTYSALLKDKTIPKDISGGGTSLEPSVAYIKAVMEAIERFSLIPKEEDYKNFKKRTVIEIEEENEIDLNQFIKFSKEQLQKDKFKISRINRTEDSLLCCNVVNLLKEKNTIMPSQFFYLPYFENEKIIRLPISTGAASGFSREECIYRGVLEIIERDQYINSYLAKIPGVKLHLLNAPKAIKDILEEFSFYKLIPHMILLESDINIPTVLTILEDITMKGPQYTLGMKCSTDLVKCIKSSLEEAFHSRRWLRYEMETKGEINKIENTENIAEILDRGLVWASEKSKGKLDFWIKNPNNKTLDLSGKNQEIPYENLIEIIKKKKWHCYVKDFSTESTSRFGVKCFKVFIPEAHPLYLDERYPYLDTTRIMEILPNKKFEINNFLQPFL